MPDDSGRRDLTRRVDRAALERVLARAAELQASSGEADESLTEAQILDLGKEAGLSPEHLRQALAEEETRSISTTLVPAQRGLLARARRAAAQRALAGSPAELLRAIDTRMQGSESLRIKRQRPERIVWEARTDVLSNVRRAVGGGDFALARAFEVSATVVPVDAQRTLVRLDADFTPYRRRLAINGAAATAVGVAGSVTLLVLGFAPIVAALPGIATGSGSLIGVRTVHQHTLERAQVSLERLLDELEQRAPQRPASLGTALAQAANQMAALIDRLAGDRRSAP